ncbi:MULTISPECIES: ubiquitin-like small modifier protein 1 [Salinibaculum]|uniref:ubiquitin-like small modifier protein 1 n=1 Tax=Salinibaculum TaxID=2732368 RepID=UPI0030D0CE5B
MEITMRFFANFREVVGQKTLHREYDDVSTVGDVLRALSEEYPDMELFEDDGSLREYLTIMRDGKDIAHIEGMETELSGGETVSVFPPVAGG